MSILDEQQRDTLTQFALALVDQKQAQVIVSPFQSSLGFWFGGGNLVESHDGTLFLVGRYRNSGDSRTGLSKGERGCELAVFASSDRGRSFEKILRWEKSDLNVGNRKVLSIEGSALRFTNDGVELFVSSEKDGIGYPPGFEQFLKPGTGIWTVDRLWAPTIEDLKDSEPETVIASVDPRFIQVKDPVVYDRDDGSMMLLFCTHPFCWTSSNTGFAVRPNDSAEFDEPVFDFFPRGVTWDVAMTRGTCVLNLPRVGYFADVDVALVFYDGGECVRHHEEHTAATSRPRGYSCEELGGAVYVVDGDWGNIDRLSQYAPLFVSPHGTGCSRYVDVLATEDGFYATWQQSQPDGSQPLVMNFLPRAEAGRLLEA